MMWTDDVPEALRSKGWARIPIGFTEEDLLCVRPTDTPVMRGGRVIGFASTSCREPDTDRLMAGFIDYAKRAEKAARLERSLADMLKPRPATLADVLKNPAGTLLRRRSWPVHWWVEIVHPKGFVGLKYVAIADGKGPNGREFLRGQAVTFGELGIEASTATDWEVLDEPPIKVLSPFDASDPTTTHPRDVTCALMINGRLIPVEKLPDALGRKMTVLVVEPA